MNIERLSGLDTLQAMIREEIPSPSIFQTIPMKIVQAEKGKVVFHGLADDAHSKAAPGVYEGFAAALLDSVTACAMQTLLDPGVEYGTLDLSIKMIKPITGDEPLVAEGSIVDMSSSLGISEGVLKSKSGKLYATATAVYDFNIIN